MDYSAWKQIDAPGPLLDEFRNKVKPKDKEWQEKYFRIVVDPLLKNQNLDFVQRLFDPAKSPAFQSPDKSGWGSHAMTYFTTDGGAAIVCPTIVRDPQTNTLKRLTPEEAYNHAVSTGEFLKLPSAEDAEFFGKNYKAIWSDK